MFTSWKLENFHKTKTQFFLHFQIFIFYFLNSVYTLISSHCFFFPSLLCAFCIAHKKWCLTISLVADGMFTCHNYHIRGLASFLSPTKWRKKTGTVSLFTKKNHRLISTGYYRFSLSRNNVTAFYDFLFACLSFLKSYSSLQIEILFSQKGFPCFIKNTFILNYN